MGMRAVHAACDCVAAGVGGVGSIEGLAVDGDGVSVYVVLSWQRLRCSCFLFLSFFLSFFLFLSLFLTCSFSLSHSFSLSLSHPCPLAFSRSFPFFSLSFSAQIAFLSAALKDKGRSILHCDWMEKKSGGFFANWKRRFFVMTRRDIKYYEYAPRLWSA